MDQLDGEPQHAHDAEADADGLRDLEEFCIGKFGMSESRSQLSFITQKAQTPPVRLRAPVDQVRRLARKLPDRLHPLADEIRLSLQFGLVGRVRLRDVFAVGVGGGHFYVVFLVCFDCGVACWKNGSGKDMRSMATVKIAARWTTRNHAAAAYPTASTAASGGGCRRAR